MAEPFTRILFGRLTDLQQPQWFDGQGVLLLALSQSFVSATSVGCLGNPQKRHSRRDLHPMGLWVNVKNGHLQLHLPEPCANLCRSSLAGGVETLRMGLYHYMLALANASGACAFMQKCSLQDGGQLLRVGNQHGSPELAHSSKDRSILVCIGQCVWRNQRKTSSPNLSRL